MRLDCLWPINTRVTRQSRSLHSSVGRVEAKYKSFSFHGVNIWNYLSKHIPTNVSYNRFNNLTKSYLLNNNILILFRDIHCLQ